MRRTCRPAAIILFLLAAAPAMAGEVFLGVSGGQASLELPGATARVATQVTRPSGRRSLPSGSRSTSRSLAVVWLQRFACSSRSAG